VLSYFCLLAYVKIFFGGGFVGVGSCSSNDNFYIYCVGGGLSVFL
jgi:hypothetical protein